MPPIPLPAAIVLVTGVAALFAASAIPRRMSWSLFCLAGHAVAGTALALGLVGGDEATALRTAFDWLLLAIGASLVAILAGVSNDVDSRSRATAALAPGALTTAVGAGMLAAWAKDLVVLFLGLVATMIAAAVPLVRSADDEEGRRAALLHLVLLVCGFVVLACGLVAVAAQMGTFDLVTSSTLPGVDAVRPVSTTAGRLTVTLVLGGLAIVMRLPPFTTGEAVIQESANPWLAGLVTLLPRVTATLCLIRLIPVLCSLHPGTTRLVCLLFAGLAALLSGVRAVRDRNPRTSIAAALVCHFSLVVAAIGVGAWDLVSPAESIVESNRFPAGLAAGLLHLVTHVLVALGLCAVLVHVARPERPVDFDEDLDGLGRTQPVAGVCLAVHAAALAGLPPTLGFWSRVVATGALVSVPGAPRPLFLVVALLQGVAGVLLVAVAGRWISAAWFARARSNLTPRGGEPALAVGVLLAVLVLGTGLVPGPLLEWLRLAATRPG